MGIFSSLFGKKVEAAPPGAGIGYGDFATPRGKVPIVPAHYNGGDGWAPRVGIELPAVANQDAILVHYDKEDPDEAPGASGTRGATHFWATRNAWRISQYPKDRLGVTESATLPMNGQDSWVANGQQGTGYHPHAALDPKMFAEKWAPDRPTAYMSPSTVRPMSPIRSGRGDLPHLDGAHFSMASMHRSYPIRGMQPARRYRNTFRLEPPPRDAQNVDMPSEAPSVPSAEFTSPNLTVAPSRSGSYRL